MISYPLIYANLRSGHILSISSGAGMMGFEFNSAYCAAKFGLEGWMEALQPEVMPFGIHTTIVNPGFFRTELLTQESTTYVERSIEDYAERHTARRAWYESQHGQQSGDPAKLARALVMIAGQQAPPRRFIAGADAISVAEQKVQDLHSRSMLIATCRPRWHWRRGNRPCTAVDEWQSATIKLVPRAIVS